MSRDEKLLWNAGEDTIHDPSRMKMEMTPQQKRQNFWFYHKVHVIVGIVVLFVIGFFIYDIVTKVDPDYSIGIISNTNYPESVIGKMEEEFAAIGEDLNGDGKVVVSVMQYTMTDPNAENAVVDPNMQMASQTKLAADMSTCQSILFLVDDYNFKNFQENQQLFSYLDGTVPEEGATDYENMKISWTDSKFLSGMDLGAYVAEADGKQYSVSYQDFVKNLSLCLRTFYDTQFAEDESKISYYNKCIELFNKIKE